MAQGIGRDTAQAVPVTLGQVWSVGESAEEMTLLKERGAAPKPTDAWAAEFVAQGADSCTVKNALKEAYYEVRYRAVTDLDNNSELYGYKVASVTVDVVLQQELKFDGDYKQYCKPDPNTLGTLAGYKFTQSFGIKFLPQI